MDKQTQVKTPDYKQIFWDILNLKYPEKKEICEPFFKKQHLSAFDIIRLNEKIFGSESPRLRSYSKSDILKILDYQKKHNLNNSELANHFRLSRNTVTKWKEMFLP